MSSVWVDVPLQEPSLVVVAGCGCRLFLVRLFFFGFGSCSSSGVGVLASSWVGVCDGVPVCDRFLSFGVIGDTAELYDCVIVNSFKGDIVGLYEGDGVGSYEGDRLGVSSGDGGVGIPS